MGVEQGAGLDSFHRLGLKVQNFFQPKIETIHDFIRDNFLNIIQETIELLFGEDDSLGNIIQDNFAENIDGTSITNENWKNANTNLITGLNPVNSSNPLVFMNDWWGESSWGFGGWYGQRYGGDPVNMQVNG